MSNEPLQKYDISKEFGVNTNTKGSSWPLHWHTFYEVEYIVEGSSTQTINGYSYHQKPGFLSILTPNDFHCFKSENNCLLTYKKFVFLESFVSPELIHILKSRKKPCIIQIPEDRQQDFHHYFDLMYQYNSLEQTSISKLLLKSMAETVCAESLLLEQSATSSTEDSEKNILLNYKRDEILHNITKYIEQNFQDSIKIQEVAKVAYQSETYFSHYFKNKFGLSFTDYLKQYRLRHAANLLVSSNKSIAEIGEKSGFSSITFFNRAFKDFYNLTPSQYRSSFRNE